MPIVFSFSAGNARSGKEDIYGITIGEADWEVCLRIGKDKGKTTYDLLQMLTAWQEQASKLAADKISKEEYEQLRYHYPKFDTTQKRAKVPSQELSDTLVAQFKDQLKDI